MNNKKLFQFLKFKYSVLFILFICIIFGLSIFYWNKSTFTGITLTDIKLSAPNNPNEKHIIDNYYPTEITLGPKAKEFNTNEVNLMNFAYQHTWGKYGNVFSHEFLMDNYFIDNGYDDYVISSSGYKFVLNDLLSQELVNSPAFLQYANMNPVYQIENPYPYYKKNIMNYAIKLIVMILKM